MEACKAPDCNCDGRGCWARQQNEAAAEHALSPARVEAMAREYCRIMGLDADELVELVIDIRVPPGPQWKRYERKAREFIAMQLAYEGTKG